MRRKDLRSYNAASNLTTVTFNTDSNFATSEMTIQLVGNQPLAATDFLL